MSEATSTPALDPIEQSVQEALKLWPAPWRRYNGRIIAINGAIVGHFAPKIPVAGAEQVAPGIEVGKTTVEAISTTIFQIVGLGEIMERAFANERHLRVANRKIAKLQAHSAALPQLVEALKDCLPELVAAQDSAESLVEKSEGTMFEGSAKARLKDKQQRLAKMLALLAQYSAGQGGGK